jgi:hypothetical protein
MSSLQQNWRKGQNRFCLEARGVGDRGKGRRAGGRNDPSKVCTYEYVNKGKKINSKLIKDLNVRPETSIREKEKLWKI